MKTINETIKECGGDLLLESITGIRNKAIEILNSDRELNKYWTFLPSNHDSEIYTRFTVDTKWGRVSQFAQQGIVWKESPKLKKYIEDILNSSDIHIGWGMTHFQVKDNK